MRNALIAVSLVLLGLPLAAQQKDFLTAREVEQVRQVQEPDQRLLLYLSFAQLRIEQLEQLFNGNKTGRSILIHYLLDQYTKIIEAMDTVVDDAIRSRKEVGQTLKDITAGQQKLVEKLEAWQASDPKDLDRYEFVLATAIETTHDSIDLNQEDIGGRKAQVLAEEKAEKQERRQMMTPEDAKASQQAEKKAKEQQRKAPSLYKKGEKKTGGTPPGK